MEGGSMLQIEVWSGNGLARLLREGGKDAGTGLSGRRLAGPAGMQGFMCTP